MKKLTLLVMPLMTLSLLASCNKGGGDTPEPPEPPEPELKRWYEYEDWWNYCSNGNPANEATKDDVGKEVNVTIYGLNHKVRLIDIDHIEPKEEVAQAHCTFEFVNVITNSNGAMTTNWDESENYNFPDSTLDDLLNKNNDCIFKKLPDGLQRVIKEVNKKVGIGSSYSTNTPYMTKLFPLSHDEMIDHDSYVPYGEGTKYQYYIDHPNKEDRIKRKVGSETEDEGENYWFRSPNMDDSDVAWRVGGDGNHGDAIIKYDPSAVAPAFCI